MFARYLFLIVVLLALTTANNIAFPQMKGELILNKPQNSSSAQSTQSSAQNHFQKETKTEKKDKYFNFLYIMLCLSLIYLIFTYRSKKKRL
jgi:uncharacterized ion transporter superfamily protein YfcC